ncbi:hypothetical protein [Bacillus cereus]|uniref:hypothetical protein n=1 Tax=Bacillus cereus TaxID=1396 RepID=UPI000BF9AE6D|nr:hypothetical protein [Bacillus cereus]PFA76923.1 hypothetical protein CN406_17935 [Bacillus cereus]
MKIKKYNNGDNGEVFATMENNDVLALKWMPFAGDMTMVTVDVFKGEEMEFDKNYRVFLVKTWDIIKGKYQLSISVEEGSKYYDSCKVPLTSKQYYKPTKEMILKKLCQSFHGIIEA